MTTRDAFTGSPQIAIYSDKENRKGFASLYESERATIERALPNVQSVIDIGCLNGDLYGAISERKRVDYLGVDIDPAAIEIAKPRHPGATFRVGDFIDPTFSAPRADMVVALNLFDHFADWKSALRDLCRFSKRYVNFSTLLRIDGGPSLTEKDLSFIHYGGAGTRILWAVHSVWWLAAYAATEEIGATSIYVHCYEKHAARFSNLARAAHAVHALPLNDLYVGNVLIELGEPMQKTNIRPTLEIIADGKAVFNSPWRG